MNLKKILALDNPWWEDGQRPEEADSPRRLYYPSLASMVLNSGPGWITVLMGMRRIGKTHMFMQLVGDVLQQGIYEPGQIVFLDASHSDLRQHSIRDLVQACKKGVVNPEREWLLLIDEVQYFDDWEAQLKTIADYERGFKCAVTGSAATALRKKRSETGHGRLQEINLPPLLFCEYLHFSNAWPAGLPQEDFASIAGARLSPEEIGKFNHEFINYMNFGAFPLLAFEYRRHGSVPSLRSMARRVSRGVVRHFVLRELPALLGANSDALLQNLGNHLIANNACEYSQDKFAKHLEVSPGMVRKYLRFLEAIHFIRVFKKINDRRNTLQHSHTHCKFVLENCSVPSLADAPFGTEYRSEGRRVEGTVLAQFGDERLGNFGYVDFNRDGKKTEVDLCHLNIHRWPLMLAEVKWRNDNETFQQVKKNFDHLVGKWCRKDGPQPELYCTSESVYGELGDMRIIPAAQFSAALGMNRVASAPVYEPLP